MWVNTLLIVGTAFVVACLAVVIANLVLSQREIRYEIDQLPELDSLAWLRQLSGIVGLTLVEGNRIRLLSNGHNAFPAMFDAVRRAEQSVTFENYIYWSGQVGRDFAQLLADKADQGVRVHVVLDWVGSMSMDAKSIRMMSDAGVKVHRWDPAIFLTSMPAAIKSVASYAAPRKSGLATDGC